MYNCRQNYMRSIINKARQLNILPLSETEPAKIISVTHAHLRETGYDMHFGLELGIVLSGGMRRHYQGYSRLIRRGQVWFCGMWEPHGFEMVNTPCDVVVVIIWPPLLAQLRFEEAPGINWMAPFTVNPADRPQIAPEKRKLLLEKADELKKLIAVTKPVEKAQIRICLLNILTMVLDRCPELISDKASLHAEHWILLNRTVQQVFNKHVFVSTSQAAKECGLNRNVFSQLFKKWMGIKFADFALRFRLKQAAGRLLSGNDPMKSIARQWGFVDTSHFNRVFWKHYGCSPSVFRRRHVSQKT